MFSKVFNFGITTGHKLHLPQTPFELKQNKYEEPKSYQNNVLAPADLPGVVRAKAKGVLRWMSPVRNGRPGAPITRSF